MTMEHAQELNRGIGRQYCYLVMPDVMVEAYEMCADKLVAGECDDPECVGRMMRQLIAAVKDSQRFVESIYPPPRTV